LCWTTPASFGAATTAGINRYDGNSFTQFFVPGQTAALADEVTAILLLPDDRLALELVGDLASGEKPPLF